MTVLIFVTAVLAMILLPLLAAGWLRRQAIVPWLLFCVGMLTFVASQLYHIPLNEWLGDVGVLRPLTGDNANLWPTALWLGLSAGASETLARVVGYWFLFRRGLAQRWSDGLMVGLGHGGIEAMIVGAVMTAASLSSLWALRGVDLNTLGMTAAELTAVSTQLDAVDKTPLLVFAAVLERTLALTLHVAISMMVWRAFQQRQPLWALLGLLVHTVFDTMAVWAAQTFDSVWTIEGILLLMALPLAVWLWQTWLLGRQRPLRQLNSLAVDVRLLRTALGKELLYLWRSKRLLVVCTVFLLFGLSAPLLAKFTPELVRSLEEAAQFADLIPDPTAADAIAQYVEFITQFGFILVIVLGMGAVAGEKAQGTAPMILSKPLPRWAFLLSKFVALALLYLAAFLLAALAAYTYTWVLFEPLALGEFLAGNGLLWLWVLVFTAVTLLASTLTNSTGAAAGLALAGSVLLLIGGAIPRLAPVLPGALVSWAGQLGLETAVPFNGGALTAAAVLIVVCLVTAVAVFEQQEL